MKKSLIALAVLGAYAGVASAQSSVKLDGTLDVGVQTVKNGSALKGSQQRSMSTNGINSSQFRVSGVEDLGGGLRAGFNLNSGVFPDTGQASSETSGKFWNRRATVSLMGGFGEVRLGRDYTPTFWNITLFDPFGTNGIGTTILINSSTLGTNAKTTVRADNAIQYWTPAMGGFEVQAMVAANEGNPTGATTGNKYQGIRFGYAAGPVAVGVALGNTTVAVGPGTNGSGDDKLNQSSIAGSYKFGPAKVNLMFTNNKNGNFKEADLQLGAAISVGQGLINFAYNKLNKSGAGTDANDATHVAVGYIYNLSTRTALYGTYASLKNKGTSKQVIGGTNTGMANGETSNGAEFGLRHFF